MKKNDNSKWEKEWKDFWMPLLKTNGKWDGKKIENEMHDLVFIYEQISIVYEYITGGLLSKPMYYADTIKTAYDDSVTESAKEEVQDYKQSLIQWLEGEKKSFIFPRSTSSRIEEKARDYVLDKVIQHLKGGEENK